jgi:hypothetical protein
MSKRPTPASGWLSVYSGQQNLGHVISRGKCGVEAFDANEASLGIFATQAEAVAAVITAGVAR